MTLNLRQDTSTLRQQCLSYPEILAQSVADIAPAGMVSVTIPLVFASAGKGTWFAYLIATIGLVLVSLNIKQFARRSASPGAIYIYITRGLGFLTGVISGWSLILAYLGTAMTILAGFAISTNLVLSSFGFQAPPILLYAVCAGLAWFYAFMDVQLSTILMLILELTSMVLILVLAILVLWQHGLAIDVSQFSLQGVSAENLRLGLVLAIFSYVGFESATTLGDEAKKPLRFIPQAVIWSTILAGTFFVVLSYVEVLGFDGYKTSLDKSDVPLTVLANLVGAQWLGILISVGVTLSFFTCTLAAINAGARILFAMARHGFFPTSVGQVHAKNSTPHIAVTVSAMLVFCIPATMSMFGIQPLDIYGYLGTIATYGFLLAYILVSIAAPAYLYQLGRLRPGNIAIAVLATIFMLIPVVGSIYPVPPAPYNCFPYLFLAYLAVGAGWFFWLKLRSPQMIQEIEQDLEAIHHRHNVSEVN